MAHTSIALLWSLVIGLEYRQLEEEFKHKQIKRDSVLNSAPDLIEVYGEAIGFMALEEVKRLNELKKSEGCGK